MCRLCVCVGGGGGGGGGGAPPFIAYATTSPGWVASHSKDPWWFPSTLCLMVIKAVHLQSQWSRSCTLRQQFGQIGSWDWSSWLRYCLREGWWPYFRRARRTSSFLLLICFGSWESLQCWYTKAMRLCVGKALQIVSLIAWMELDKETGRLVSVAIVVGSFAALWARSLPGMAEWPGIDWMKMEDDMELMELWIENVWGLDEMRASRKELLSVQKSVDIEGWLALVDVQDNADSMAAASSS